MIIKLKSQLYKRKSGPNMPSLLTPRRSFNIFLITIIVSIPIISTQKNYVKNNIFFIKGQYNSRK